jgi:Ribonuclease T2 family
MTRILSLLAAALLLVQPAEARHKRHKSVAQESAARVPGDFDYYVLSLSWSPTYCAGDAGQHDDQQCSPGRKFAFVVHGLWPQYTKGWPQDCPTNEAWIDQSQIDAMMDIMPSKKLIIHEWKKHGTCAGALQHGPHTRPLSLPHRRHHDNAKPACDGLCKEQQSASPRDAGCGLRQCPGCEQTLRVAHLPVENRQLHRLWGK